MRVALIALLLVPLVRGESKPTPKEVRDALQTLAIGDRRGAPEAMKILARDGKKKSIEAIGDFGARDLYRQSTVLAGKALAGTGEAVAVKAIKRLARANKKNPKNLARVALMAEQIPGNAGRDLLIGFTRESRARVAATAVRGLGARREEGARSILLKLLKSPRPVVASAAAYALSHLEPRQETMELLFKRAQTGRRERIGDACALALSRMEGARPFGNRALALLIKRSSDDSFHALVKLAMRLATEPDRERLAVGLKSPAPEVREVMCDMIGLRNVQGFQDQLLRAATTEHRWRNQVAAWLAVRRVGPDGIEDEIVASIGQTGERSYWAIQCAIRNPRKVFLPSLRNAALDIRDPVRRDLAQRALRAAGQSLDETREFLLEAAAASRGRPRAMAALMAIGNLKDDKSFKALVTLLRKETAYRYKLWILKGLEKLTGHYFKPDPKIWEEWYQLIEGQVAFEPQVIDRRRNRERVRKNLKLGISTATEKAVENGLLWLTRHQDQSGAWDGATYHENCIDGDCAREGGIRERPLAYTALAILAYQGAGYSHKEGPYRDVIQRGFEYIQTNQDYDGSHNDRTWTFSYEAALMCQCLCDGFALTGDPWLREGAQRMIDYLVKIQFPGRTWRYHVRSSETDTSIMSWILLACVSARHAGIDMPEQIFTASEVWLDKAADPIPPDTFEVFFRDLYRKTNTYFIDISKDEKGKTRQYRIKTWYQPPRLYTPAMSSIGLLARIWLGWTRAHPFSIGAANQVVSQIPGYTTGLEKEAGFYPYTWYYGSLAMYQMGGRYWTRWREKCIDEVIQHQQRAGCHLGSWKMPRGQFFSGLTGGTVYCTSMAILTLESFYRYQPYLARFKLRSREAPTDEEKKKAEEAKRKATPLQPKQDDQKKPKGGSEQ